METLTRAAVAEICELVDDGYAILHMEINRHQKEKEELRRKLQLIESIVAARGYSDEADAVQEATSRSARAEVIIVANCFITKKLSWLDSCFFSCSLYNWKKYHASRTMVQHAMHQGGNVERTRVLRQNQKSSITLTCIQKKRVDGATS